MPKTAVEKKTCPKCDADVRENTEFCYNCGADVTAEEQPIPAPDDKGPVSALDPKAQAALDDLAEKLKNDEAEKGEKLAKAAEERKKARVDKRKPRTYRWEPVPDSSMSYVILVAVVIGLLAGAVVVITVFVK